MFRFSATGAVYGILRESGTEPITYFLYALFSFTLSWNEFLYALVLTTNQYSRTATVGINTMLAEDVFFWGKMMAASVITAAPPVIMYFFSQKWVVGGLTLGGVKA